MIDTSRTLDVQTDANIYQIGNTSTITANLANGGAGLPGATVTANLTFQDSTGNLVNLTDPENDGSYTAFYPIPGIPGHLSIDITATGNDNGIAFTRQESLLVSIAPNDLHLTGNYAALPNDDNDDLLYEYLDFDVELNADLAGEYAISAELYAGTQLITQAADYYPLSAGIQTVTLPFDGGAIREMGLNGPYTISNLNATPLDIGITAQSAVNVLETSAYSYTQFGLVGIINPIVNSITRVGANLTSATSVNFTVTFSKSVNNVDAGDFILTTSGVSGAAISGVSGSGSTYTVTVNTGINNGTIRLDVPVSATITDLAGNPLANLPFTSGQAYTISKPIPKAPALRSPRTNMVTNDTTPTFWWTKAKDGQTYEIEFAADT